jgi:glutamate racemase
MQLNNLPIGVFDSGVGGLTVLKQLTKTLPNESFVYIGDLARLPYGKKSTSAILKYTQSICNYLISQGVKCIVIACNTASSIALHAFESQNLGIPIIGVVQPGAVAVTKISKNKRVIVLATEATVKSKIYVEQIKNCEHSIEVTSVSCPLLVSLAEEGWINDPITKEVILRYVGPILRNKSQGEMPDSILLGCTHFPVLLEDFKAVLPKEIKIVCSAEATATHVKNTMTELQIHSKQINHSANRYIVTDNKNRFLNVAKSFIQEHLTENNIELVEINI